MKHRARSILRNVCWAALLAVNAFALPAAAQTSDARFDVICVADRNAKEIANRKACLDTVPVVRFGSEITLAVEHAPEVDFDDSGEPAPAALVLFLEGKALPGSRARVGNSELDKEGITTTLLTFDVTRDLSTETARQNWKEVLVAAQNRPRLAVSAGVETGAPARTRAEVELQVIDMKRLYLWVLLAAVIVVVFFWITAKSGCLRDGEPLQENMKDADRAYSLARVQMAAWTVIILLSFLYVWCLTREFNGSITTTALVLMGVSAGTYAGAVGVDSQKQKSKQQEADEVESERPEGTRARARLKTLQQQSEVCKTEGFFRDLLTSAEGPSLHRLQFIAWTIVLMVVFVVGVKETLTMPQFDETLLGLMGISSGAYVGLKLPERKA